MFSVATKNVTLFKILHLQERQYVTVGAFFDNGYMLALLMFLVTLVQNSLLQTHYHLVIREGIRLRAALQVIYWLSGWCPWPIHGYMLDLLMFLVTPIKNSFLQTLYHLVIREGIRLRAALQVRSGRGCPWAANQCALFDSYQASAYRARPLNFHQVCLVRGF